VRALERLGWLLLPWVIIVCVVVAVYCGMFGVCK
jgi:hypothetical protein